MKRTWIFTLLSFFYILGRLGKVQCYEQDLLQSLHLIFLISALDRPFKEIVPVQPL